MEEELDTLVKYARKEELNDLPREVASLLKQLKGIACSGGRYEIVVEEDGENGTIKLVAYTLRRSRRLGTSKYPGWERTKKLAELELDEEKQKAIHELHEKVSQRLA